MLLSSSPPPFLITFSLLVPALNCTGGHLIQSPLALVPYSNLFLLRERLEA